MVGEFRARVRGLEITYGGEKGWSLIFPANYKPIEGIVPSEYLIASIGGCAIMHVAIFCKKHRLSSEKVHIDLSWEGDARQGELIKRVIMDVKVPSIPEKLEQELVKEIRDCTVIASICLPPKFEVNILQS